MPGGNGAHFAEASLQVQRQKGRAMLPDQCGLQAASHSCRCHNTGEGPGKVPFHLGDVEAWSDEGLLEDEGGLQRPGCLLSGKGLRSPIGL